MATRYSARDAAGALEATAPSRRAEAARQAPAGPAPRRVQRDVAVVTAVLTAWELLLEEQPEQIKVVQARLTASLVRAQELMEQIERRVNYFTLAGC
jgi:hypothetical protein